MSAPHRLGEAPTVDPSAELHHVTLGRWTEIGAACQLEHVEMGDYSYCGPRGIFQNATIGRFANIAAAVRIGPTAHPMDRPTQHHFTYRRVLYRFAEQDDEAFFAWRRQQRTRIGHDTWIGHGAIVMPNVTIGTGAVVGAGAIVTRDVPRYAVAVGVPARVVRSRFDEATIEALLDIAWWHWSHARLQAALDDLSGPVDAFVEKHRGAS